MVGGIVREVFRFGDKLALLIRGKDEDKEKYLAVDLIDQGDVIVPGDDVWWQGNLLMWNPRDGRWTDKQLERAPGYTYDANTFWRKAAVLARDGTCPVCSDSEIAMHDGLGSIYCNVCGASYDLSDMLRKGE